MTQNHSRFSTMLVGAVGAAAAILLILPGDGGAQLSYRSGQNVSPAYEGWEQNEDGSFNFLFGYMNRNWEEEIDVPVGPDNMFEPGPADRGQPTHFLPRRNRFVFRVRVPADWGEERELIWTLTTKGKTEKAYATLRTDYLVDNVVIASETGALGAGTSSPETRSNQAPTLTVEGAKTRTVKAGEPLTLVATIADDGIPKTRASLLSEGRPRIPDGGAPNLRRPEDARPSDPALIPPSRVTVGKVNGLHLSWFVYRGAGQVKFDPMQIKVWEDTRAGANSPWAPLWRPPTLPEDGRITTSVTFAEPGDYVLRARVDDGALFADEEVTVTVTP